MLHWMNSVLHIGKWICVVLTKMLAIANVYVSLERENVKNQNKKNFNFPMKYDCKNFWLDTINFRNIETVSFRN